MSDPKKRQRFFDFMSDCLTASMLRDAVLDIASKLSDEQWKKLWTIDIETLEPIDIFKKEDEDGSGKF